MHEHRFHGDIGRLRSPERLAWLEVDHVVELSLQDGDFRRVLDVGTGSGIFAETFSKAGLDVVGVDANPKMLETARNLVPGVRFDDGIAESLPYPDGAFDLVFMGLLFHETDNRLQAMREAARVAHQRVTVLEWPYKEQEIGPGLDERLTEKQVTDLAAQAGLKVWRVLPLHSLVLYVLER
ncbi:MAG TPA: class I SAM-dependent methyltransferase [Anaerolineales bacterium]|nr:class I SAM-dependent methyltransferase [Anaerolineales bacterium]